MNKKILSIFLLLFLIPIVCLAGNATILRVLSMYNTASEVAGSWFGSSAEPADEDSTANVTTTYIFTDALSVSGDVTQIQIYGTTNQWLKIGAFTKDGSDFTEANYVTGIQFTSGLNTLTAPTDFTAFAVSSGQYIGVSSDCYWEKATTGGSGYWYDADNDFDGVGTTFTESGNTTHELQLRVYIE